MTVPAVELVVARFREDVSWVGEVGYPAVVYDKSGAPGEFALPNIGRETHTYLTHILRRYGDLAGMTVFVQGDPFKHMGPGATPTTLRERIAQALRLGLKFSGLADFKLKCDRLGRPHAMADPDKRGQWAGWGKDIPVGAVYERLFAGPSPETFVVPAPAGLFMAARERILARPFGFYRAALALVEADPEDAANTGHAFERLWHIVLGGEARLNRPEYA